MLQLPNSSHPSTTDEIEDEFGDEDRPRSPSPEFRGSDGTANDIPLIPTHGAHRTVEVDFSSSQGDSIMLRSSLVVFNCILILFVSF